MAHPRRTFVLKIGDEAVGRLGLRCAKEHAGKVLQALVKAGVKVEPPSADPSTCDDCSKHAPFYVVENAVWAKAVAKKPAQYLCLACLEQRLGRLLLFQDFPEVPVNQLVHYMRPR